MNDLLFILVAICVGSVFVCLITVLINLKLYTEIIKEATIKRRYEMQVEKKSGKSSV